MVADRLVGTCTLTVIPNLTRNGRSYGIIENVVTDERHRRQGIGKALLQAALERAWTAGCYKVTLTTGSRRPETLAFYEGAGFRRDVKTAFEAKRP